MVKKGFLSASFFISQKPDTLIGVWRLLIPIMDKYLSHFVNKISLIFTFTYSLICEVINM